MLAPHRFLVLAALALTVSMAALAAPQSGCSNDDVERAIATLERCGFSVEVHDRLSCVDALTTNGQFVITDPKVIGETCKPGTSGACVRAVLQKGIPANDKGWSEIGELCRTCEARFVIDFLQKYQLDLPAMTARCPKREAAPHRH